MDGSKRQALIYALVDPRDGDIRYVGWTSQTLAQRYKSHLAYKSRAHRSKWIRALKRDGPRPIMRLLHAVPLADGPRAEIYWIQFHRDLGCRLVNLTEGGDGAPGVKPSAETRAKMHAAHLGKQPTDETRRKLQTSARNRTAEHRQKIGAANAERSWSDESRAKISAYRSGRETSAATRKKLSDAGRRRKLTDAEREKIREAARKRWADPNWRKAQAWLTK